MYYAPLVDKKAVDILSRKEVTDMLAYSGRFVEGPPAPWPPRV
jgi:hypothetical protein